MPPSHMSRLAQLEFIAELIIRDLQPTVKDISRQQGLAMTRFMVDFAMHCCVLVQLTQLRDNHDQQTEDCTELFETLRLSSDQVQHIQGTISRYYKAACQLLYQSKHVCQMTTLDFDNGSVYVALSPAVLASPACTKIEGDMHACAGTVVMLKTKQRFSIDACIPTNMIIGLATVKGRTEEVKIGEKFIVGQLKCADDITRWIKSTGDLRMSKMQLLSNQRATPPTGFQWNLKLLPDHPCALPVALTDVTQCTITTKRSSFQLVFSSEDCSHDRVLEFLPSQQNWHMIVHPTDSQCTPIFDSADYACDLLVPSTETIKLLVSIDDDGKLNIRITDQAFSICSVSGKFARLWLNTLGFAQIFEVSCDVNDLARNKAIKQKSNTYKPDTSATNVFGVMQDAICAIQVFTSLLSAWH